MSDIEIERRVHYKPRLSGNESDAAMVYAEIKVEHDGTEYFVFSQWMEGDDPREEISTVISDTSLFDLELELEELEQNENANDPRYVDNIMRRSSAKQYCGNDLDVWIAEACSEVRARLEQVYADQ